MGTTFSRDWLLPSRLCEQTSTFLDAVYSEELALYPYTTSIVEGGYDSDYRLPGAARYTINTLLGRWRAAQAGVHGAPSRERIRHESAAFVSRYSSGLDAGDLGLLLVLLADVGDLPEELFDAVADAETALARIGPARLNLQDLSWLIWGMVRAAEAGSPDALRLAQSLRATLTELMGTGALARHVHARFRRNLVSFGSTAYFLRALHEYARVFDDLDSRARFERGVRAAIGFQGKFGEWPWLISVSGSRALDTYPVYSVHQLAMALLFLFPAYDDGVIDGVGTAVRRSFRWVMGENELGIEFGQAEPFLIFRSIERREPLPKLARFTRATLRSVLSKRAHDTPARRTRINPEWRSYEGGWLLYAWAGRENHIVT